METPFINKNSVRNRPTHSAPDSIALTASSAFPIFAARHTRFSSCVTVSLLIYFFSSCTCSSYNLRFLRYISIVFGIGCTKTSPYSPSTITVSPLPIFSNASFTLNTAGISSALARMAVCEVSPPFSATIPATCAVSITAVMDGWSSFAIIIVFSGRCVRSTLCTPSKMPARRSFKSIISAMRCATASLPEFSKILI